MATKIKTIAAGHCWVKLITNKNVVKAAQPNPTLAKKRYLRGRRRRRVNWRKKKRKEKKKGERTVWFDQEFFQKQLHQ